MILIFLLLIYTGCTQKWTACIDQNIISWPNFLCVRIVFILNVYPKKVANHFIVAENLIADKICGVTADEAEQKNFMHVVMVPRKEPVRIGSVYHLLFESYDLCYGK